MMKVLYLCPGKYSESDGIYNKVKKTVEFWGTKGVHGVILSYNDIRYTWFEKLLLWPSFGPLSALVVYLNYSRLANKVIQEFHPDIVYTRHFLFPFFIKKCQSLILEVNGDIIKETMSSPLYVRTLVKLSINYYNKNCSALVCVGKGLDQDFKCNVRLYFPNAILSKSENVLDKLNRKFKKSKESPVKLIFMATKNRQYYAIKFIIDFFSMVKIPNVELLMVGDFKLKLSKQEGKRVKFLGPLSGESLESVLNEADIAIGLIAFHKKAKASPLKTRTYIEFGLPVFSTDNDCDFSSFFPFFKAVPEAMGLDTNVYAQNLQEFIEEIISHRGNSVARLPQAIEMACIDNREMERINLFKSILQKKN